MPGRVQIHTIINLENQKLCRCTLRAFARVQKFTPVLWELRDCVCPDVQMALQYYKGPLELWGSFLRFNITQKWEIRQCVVGLG